jgi:hypothetical protein
VNYKIPSLMIEAGTEVTFAAAAPTGLMFVICANVKAK